VIEENKKMFIFLILIVIKEFEVSRGIGPL